MKIFRIIRQAYKKIKYRILGPPSWKKEIQDAPIIYAFTWQGVDFFCFENPLNMPWMRAFVAMEYMEEFNMRITKDFLLQILQAVKDEINKVPPQITEVVKWINILEERTTYIIEPETLLKIASVHFFTEEENPTSYDLAYNLRKIENWKKTKVLDFFLQLPFKELAPLMNLPKETIQTYFSGQIAKTLKTLDSLYAVLSQNQSNESKLKELLSHKQQLTQLLSKILES